MSKKRKRGIHELYAQDPIAADEALWGRRSNPVTRRGFMKRAGLASLSLAIGTNLAFAEHYPSGLIPAILADSTKSFTLPGKHPDLIILNDRPVNAETPPHLLDSPVTGADVLFVRNNGIPPERSAINTDTWVLEVGGESAIAKRTYTLAELKDRFEEVSLQLTIECGGNGRSEFQPPAKGNQWTTGAVGCPQWTGVRLRDVLLDAGIADDAVYIGYYGADTHLSGQADKYSISRGVPIDKAMESESLIAWAMNGEEMPILNGHPLRLVFGGWPASCSGKWLKKIVIRNKVHDGEKMGGSSYRIPCDPVAPGTVVSDEDMCIIESMPVKSLITFPKTGAIVSPGQVFNIRGYAWAGDNVVSKMEYSINYGVTWSECALRLPENRLAWQQFEAEVSLPDTGYYEIWARATDDTGKQQPMLVPGWNPKGYLNNACHRVAVKAE